VKHVDVLGDDAFDDARVFQTDYRVMDRSGFVAAQTVDKFAAAPIVDGRVLPEPVDVEDAFRVRLAVEPLRPPEIRYAAESGDAGPGEDRCTAARAQSVDQAFHG